MKTEDQLYGLMAQAEDIQAHAVKLQKTASEAISGLQDVTVAIDKELRSRGLFWAICGAVILLVVGILVFIGVRWAALWTLADLRQETAHLREEVALLEEQARDFKSRAGKAVLSTCEGRICIRVDERYGRFGRSDQGELYMVIHGY